MLNMDDVLLLHENPIKLLIFSDGLNDDAKTLKFQNAVLGLDWLEGEAFSRGGANCKVRRINFVAYVPVFPVVVAH